jgi:uncharacterized repeat protein (TIGR01451 family)
MRPVAFSWLSIAAWLLPVAIAAAPDPNGARPMRRTVAEIMSESRADADGVAARDRRMRIRALAERNLPQNPGALLSSDAVAGTASTLSGEQPAPPVVGTSFTSVTQGEANTQTPDTMGAVGPTQFLTHVNGRIRMHAKANGAVGPLDVSDLTFWDALRSHATGSLVRHPQVRFDRQTDRWFLTIVDVPGNVGLTAQVSSRILVAVSDGPTITAGTVWSFFFLNQDQAPPAGDTSCLADETTLAVGAAAAIIGANVYCGADRTSLEFWNSTLWVIRKGDLVSVSTPANLTLTPGAVTAFRTLLDPNTHAGMYSPLPVDDTNTAWYTNPLLYADPHYASARVMGVDGQVSGRLVEREVSDPGGGSPTLLPAVIFDVPGATHSPIPVQTPGGGPALDAGDDRLTSAILDCNREGDACWIYGVQTIGVGPGGQAVPPVDRNALRWFSLNRGYVSPWNPLWPEIATLFDASATDPASYWVGTLSRTGQGHLALGMSTGGPALAPGAGTVGRLLGQTPGAPSIYKAAEANYVPPNGGWGRTSMTSLDPCDNMSAWTIQEYAGSSNQWGTAVARLMAPPPGAPALSVGVIPQGLSSVPVTFTGTNWYDPPTAGMSSCRRSISVLVDGGVKVNSAAWALTYSSPPYQLTVDLDTSGASVGPKTVTVVNPDGQSAQATILNVVSVPVLRASKTVAGNFGPGGSIAYTVTLSNLGTFAQADAPGDEFTDVLPATLDLVSATASSGVVTADPSTRTVTWNGVVVAGGTITITINATIKPYIPLGTEIPNQGTVHFDSNADGINDATVLTDDPRLQGAADPTVLVVGAGYYTVTPCRVVDTRGPSGPQGAPALSPGLRTFSLLGSCGIPTGAKAASLNLTVTQPEAAGDLRLYPAGSAPPLSSAINFAPGQTRANNVVAVLSASGDLAVQCDQALGTVQLIIDVNGYFR